MLILVLEHMFVWVSDCPKSISVPECPTFILVSERHTFIIFHEHSMIILVPERITLFFRLTEAPRSL